MSEIGLPKGMSRDDAYMAGVADGERPYIDFDDLDEEEEMQKPSSRVKTKVATDPNDFDQVRSMYPAGQLYDLAHYLANESGSQASLMRIFLPVGDDRIEPANLARWVVEVDGFEFRVMADDNYNIIDYDFPPPTEHGSIHYPVMMLLATIDWLNSQLNACRNPQKEVNH